MFYINFTTHFKNSLFCAVKTMLVSHIIVIKNIYKFKMKLTFIDKLLKLGDELCKFKTNQTICLNMVHL